MLENLQPISKQVFFFLDRMQLLDGETAGLEFKGGG